MDGNRDRLRVDALCAIADPRGRQEVSHGAAQATAPTGGLARSASKISANPSEVTFPSQVRVSRCCPACCLPLLSGSRRRMRAQLAAWTRGPRCRHNRLSMSHKLPFDHQSVRSVKLVHRIDSVQPIPYALAATHTTSMVERRYRRRAESSKTPMHMLISPGLAGLGSAA